MRVCTGQVLISILFGDKLNSDKLEFGLVVSPTLCNITNIDSKYRPALALGLYFNWKLTDRLYFHPEADPKSAFGAAKIPPYSVGNAGIDSLFEDGDVQRKIKALSLPLLMRYRVTGRWFVEAGPQVDLNLSVQDIFKAKKDGNELTNTVNVEDQFTRFNVGAAMGLMYRLTSGISSMGLGIRYYYGFTDIMKTASGGQHNSAWLLNIYIPIGAGKAAAKREKEHQSS